MTARSAPTGTVSSSWTRISCRVPATGDGISVSTLSVETSSSGSSTSMRVADVLQPAGDGAFGDGLTQGRHGHAFRHVVSLLLSVAVSWLSASGVGVQRLAGQGQVGLAEGLVLGGVRVDQTGDVRRVGPPS